MTHRRTTALAAAAAITASLLAASPAHAAEPDWQRVLTGPAGGFVDVAAVAAAPDGLSYALLNSPGGEVGTRLVGLDTATGATAWTLDDAVGTFASAIEVDDGSGGVVVQSLSDTYPYSSVLTAVDPTGKVSWARTLPPGEYLIDVDLDETSGTLCGIAGTDADSAWRTRCWDRNGRMMLAKKADPARRAEPLPADYLRIVVDKTAGRVVVAGLYDLGSFRRGYQRKRTVLAYSLSGRRAWRSTRTIGTRTRLSTIRLAHDRGRLYVVSEHRRASRLESLDLRKGRVRWVQEMRGRGALSTVREIDVLPDSHRVAVTTDAGAKRTTTVTIFSPGGRRVARRAFDVCCRLAGTVVDTERDRVVLVVGRAFSSDDDEGISVHSVSSRGRLRTAGVLGPALVDQLREPSYDPGSRMLVLGTETAPGGGCCGTAWAAGVRLP